MELANNGAEMSLAQSAGIARTVTLSPPVRSDYKETGAPTRRVFLEERPRDDRPHALIIGAGLGGLSAGIHLSRQGWRVTLLEKNERCGGRMNVIREQGFSIDMGPTMLMMPDVMDDLFKSCGRRREDYFETTRLTPAYSIHWPDGTRMDMGCAKEELIAEAMKISPEDAPKIPALVKAMQNKYDNARFNFIEKPFYSISHLLRLSTIKGMFRALPLNSVWDLVGKFVKNDKLRQAFTFQTLYLGISPHECPSIFALLPYIEMEFGVWFPKGGTYALAEGLEKLFLELGGEVHYDLPVQQVLLNGKKATGVRTCDGRDWRADVVVSNADLPTVYRNLVSPDVRRKNTDSSIERLEYGCSGYLMYLGVKHMESDFGHNVILLSDNYDEILDDICIHKRLPRDPAMHVCTPTKTDPSLAPPGHDIIYVLVPCPNTQGIIDWDREAPILRERVLDKLEATGYPGLRENIVFERDFTPPEFEELYGCYAGSAYSSMSLTFMQSAYFRPHMRSEDVEGLYFVGAGTHPGGGVPIVLTAGRIVADEIVASVKRV